MADNQCIPPVTAFTEYQLDVTSDTGLPVQTVAQGICNVINSHTGFHFPEINFVVTHAFRFKMLYRISYTKSCTGIPVPAHHGNLGLVCLSCRHVQESLLVLPVRKLEECPGRFLGNLLQSQLHAIV